MANNTFKPQDFVQRHIGRIDQRKDGLSKAHDFILDKMALLKTTLALLQKTHGFFKCRFSAYLRDKIQSIKNRIAQLKDRCRSVLMQIKAVETRSFLPFV